MRGNGLARGHTADRIDAMKVFVSALDEGRLPGPAHRLRRSPTATAEVVHGDTRREEADIDRVGLSYMLMGDVRQGQGATLAQDGQRMVLYRPAYHGRAAGFSQGRAPGHQSGISPITSPIQRSTVPGPIIATSSQQPHAATTDFLGLDMRLVLQQIQIRQLWKQQLRKQRQSLHECR